jgi:hypothetical protein
MLQVARMSYDDDGGTVDQTRINFHEECALHCCSKKIRPNTR